MKLDFGVRENMAWHDFLAAPLIDKTRRINNLFALRSTLENWQNVLLFRRNPKKELIMHFRNGDYITIKIDEHIVSLKKNKQIIKLWFGSESQKTKDIGLMFLHFVKNEYKWLKVRSKIVIDIGAFVGDTALYFTLSGAKHVYAFEPYPHVYELARKNVALNGLGNKITLLNEGVAGRESLIRIPTQVKTKGSSDLKDFSVGQKVRLVTLGEIVRRFRIKNAVLKVDCEGSEYQVLLGASDDLLRHFSQIMIEYHYGYKNLIKKLEQSGFKARYTKPKYNHNADAENQNMYLGYIYAERK